MKRFLLPAAIIAVAILGAMALMATAPTLQPSAADPVATSVEAVQIQTESVQLTVHSQGTVIPATESDLVSEVAGRVIRMSPAMIAGGFFQAGDVLLEIDPVDHEAAVSRATAILSRSQAELEHARYELKRQEELSERELSSQSALENAQRAFRIAEASEREARVALEQSQRDLQRTRIVAPFTGVVRSKQVDLGQFVSRGTPIARIYATDYVEVRLPLADRQLAFLNLPIGNRGRLPEGERPAVSLSADYAGQTFNWSGEIIRTESEIDMKSRMVNVVARIENSAQDTPLNIGMFVEAEIEGVVADDIVILPRKTLRNGSQVLVIDDNDRLHYRSVELLRLYQDQVLIKSGLENNERVCVSAIQTVVEGMPVTPVMIELNNGS